MPYEDAIRELVTDPLGLHETHFFPTDVMTHRFSVGHAGPPGQPIVVRPWSIPRGMNPAGGLVMSVHDLLRYGEFMLGDGRTGTRPA